MKKVLILLFAVLASVLLTVGVGVGQDQQPTPAAENAGQIHSGMDHMDSMMPAPQCDVATFVLQQQAYTNALSAFGQAFQADPDAALRSVYNIGLTYQAFAESCGFTPPEGADSGHDAGHAADEHSSEAHMELAMAIGDPENGQTLFNTIVPETGFACATCHRVDSTETLIGPGLITVANPAHDPSQHEHGGAAAEATQEAQAEKTMDEVVDYIRTSIQQPGAFVVPGFPDLLMPQIYTQVLTEQQINDVIAYLLTLHE
jgi:cytochrome c2